MQSSWSEEARRLLVLPALATSYVSDIQSVSRITPLTIDAWESGAILHVWYLKWDSRTIQSAY